MEAGVGFRLGYNYLNVTSTGGPLPFSEPPLPAWQPFDAFGIALGGGADVRYWLDGRWGLSLTADASWMFAGQAYGSDELVLTRVGQADRAKRGPRLCHTTGTLGGTLHAPLHSISQLHRKRA